MANPIDKIIVEIQAETKELRRGLDKANKQLGNLNKQTGSATNALKQFGSVVAAIGLAQVASQAIQTIREFEDLEATLKAVTGSANAAAASFDLIRQFTATTTFQIQDVANAFIKLKLAGIVPTTDVMQDFGNFAAGMGKSITDLAQAAFNATTGEMEMLKQFGVVARLQGNTIRATFNGVTTEIERSGPAITEFLRNIGRTEFPTALADRADTLTGAVSNLQDQLSEFFVKIGEGGLKDALQDISLQFKQLLKDNESLAFQLGSVLGTALSVLANIISFVISNLNLLAGVLGFVAGAKVMGALVVVVPKVAAAMKLLTSIIKGQTAAAIMLQSVTGIGLVKVFAGVAAGGTAIALMNSKLKQADEAAADAAEGGFDELNDTLLNEMPMNERAVDAVAESVRDLGIAIKALPKGKFSISDVFDADFENTDQAVRKINEDFMEFFNNMEFAASSVSGQKSNFAKAMLEQVGFFHSQGIPANPNAVEQMRVALGLSEEQLFGPKGLFKNLDDLAQFAGKFSSDQLDNFYIDLFGVDDVKFREIFAPILGVNGLEKLIPMVAKKAKDMKDGGLGGTIAEILVPENKDMLDAFIALGRSLGQFKGLDDSQIVTFLQELHKVETDPMKDLVGLNKLLGKTLEENAEGGQDFLEQLRGMSDEAILAALVHEDFKDVLEKFGMSADEALVPIKAMLAETRDFKKEVMELPATFKSADDALRILNEGLADNKLTIESANAIYRDYLETLGPTGQAMAEIGRNVESMSDSFATDLTDALLTGQDAMETFRNFTANIISMVISEFMRLVVIKPIVQAILGFFDLTALGTPSQVSSGSGGGGGRIFLAGGGRIQRGRPTVVGERGPELFVPDHTGNIMNNHMTNSALQGGGPPIVINQSVNFATGIQGTVRAEVMQMLPQIAEVSKSAVAESAERGGSFRRRLIGN